MCRAQPHTQAQHQCQRISSNSGKGEQHKRHHALIQRATYDMTMSSCQPSCQSPEGLMTGCDLLGGAIRAHAIWMHEITLPAQLLSLVQHLSIIRPTLLVSFPRVKM